jgi:hypothetical protein
MYYGFVYVPSEQDVEDDSRAHGNASQFPTLQPVAQ